ncbi:MAG: biotin/lipoyl-binding protein [Mucilaginibacter polytrichastri]|nr:biotin/lipoyl-binding protein [Mucilaginibacter polytrichastri]
MKYTATVSDDASFAIEKTTDGQWTLNGASPELDIRKLDDQRYHVLMNNASYTVEISGNADSNVQLVVNGTPISVGISDEYDALLKKLGMNTTFGAKAAELKAPMPGLVLKVFVSDGDEVKKGDNLLILEAMKMENMIKAQGDFRIGTVQVKSGQSVEKNQLLISFSA